MTDGSESIRDHAHFPFTSRIPARQLRVSWRAFCICVICSSTVTAGELWGMNDARPFINRQQQQQHNVRGTGKMSTKVHGPQAVMCCYLFLNGPPAESIELLKGNCSQHLRNVEQPILLSIWGWGGVWTYICMYKSLTRAWGKQLLSVRLSACTPVLRTCYCSTTDMRWWWGNAGGACC